MKFQFLSPLDTVSLSCKQLLSLSPEKPSKAVTSTLARQLLTCSMRKDLDPSEKELRKKERKNREKNKGIQESKSPKCCMKSETQSPLKVY